jgi:hypothetical protein
MPRRLLQAAGEAMTPGTGKNLYDAYELHRRKKHAFDALAELCAKVAMPMAPRVPGPRLNVPGAGANVGKWNPLKGIAGKSPPAIGAKGTSPTTVINPRRNIQQAMVAFTPQKALT